MNKYIALLAFSLLIVAACTKETEYEKYPFKEITAFSVNANASTKLTGGVSDGKIYLYWPSHLPLPDSLAPQITVSENAVISPASGKNIVPASGVVYTVTAENGETATYTLQLVVSQPDITIKEGADIKGTLKSVLNLGSYLTGVLPDTNVTKVYLVPAEGDMKQLKILTISNSNLEAVTLTADVPATGLDTGWYKLKIVSGGRSATSARSFIYLDEVPPPVPVPAALPASLRLKVGETFTVTGTGLENVTNGQVRNINDFVYYPLELVSASATSLTYRISAGSPVGAYNRVEIGYKIKDVLTWVRVTGPGPILTVIE
ncbi:hypothetical protein [uncultured Chitinophaga sp.]|uniref:hypothetical protein n=1 Tax=uncultured Chitinophaga sp. TaxID=339340 RepID=UPI0025EC1C0A|nr:hypothetical protein [uncultured Chitinophaga sp.]